MLLPAASLERVPTQSQHGTKNVEKNTCIPGLLTRELAPSREQPTNLFTLGVGALVTATGCLGGISSLSCWAVDHLDLSRGEDVHFHWNSGGSLRQAVGSSVRLRPDNARPLLFPARVETAPCSLLVGATSLGEFLVPC